MLIRTIAYCCKREKKLQKRTKTEDWRNGRGKSGKRKISWEIRKTRGQGGWGKGESDERIYNLIFVA